MTNITLKQQVSDNWKNTPNFKRGIFSFLQKLELTCGENVYGKNNGKEKQAYIQLIAYLEKASNMSIFKNIPNSYIIKDPPTQQELVQKMTNIGTRALSYYKKFKQQDIVDTWSNEAFIKDGEPLNKSNELHRRVMRKHGKRFITRTISVKNQVRNIITECRGILSEGHIIAFLNSVLKCPICNAVCKLGWCEGSSPLSIDSFRDAVCTNCQSHGVRTLFEIKTRWEQDVINCGNGTYAGSYVALNTLMAIKANVYIVIASRDTGNVRIGKITSSSIRGNRNWLYALQEGFSWGSPSSFVTCDNGLELCPVTMPSLEESLDDKIIKKITDQSLYNLNLL
jgi:hypothetical protein